MKTKEEVIETMQQHLINISEMLNSRIYNLLIEFADMRWEIKQLQMDLIEIRDKFVGLEKGE